LAKAAGINAGAARIIDGDGLPVALVRRFDRTLDGRRLMYVSAATSFELNPLVLGNTATRKSSPLPHEWSGG